MLVLGLLWPARGLGIHLGIFAAGVLALGLSDSAFQAEIFRAGIQSIAPGQIDGAKSLGLNRFLLMRLVVLPQAVRNILPALGNQFVYMLKMSSILSIIGFPELTRRSNELVVTEYRPLEIYTFLVVEYLILILVASWLMRRLEHALHGHDDSCKIYEAAAKLDNPRRWLPRQPSVAFGRLLRSRATRFDAYAAVRITGAMVLCVVGSPPCECGTLPRGAMSRGKPLGSTRPGWQAMVIATSLGVA